MFGIGMPEMLLILAVALIVIGPKKLPDLARSLGKAMGEFKKATSELKESIQIDSELKEVKTAFKDINRDMKTSPSTAGAAQMDDPMDAVKAAFQQGDPPPATTAANTNGPTTDGGPVEDASADSNPSKGQPT